MPTIKVSKKDVKINLGVSSVYPALEDLTVYPRSFEQKFNHPNSYGYDEITVEPIDIKLQNKEVKPSTSEQIITPDEEYDGLRELTVKAVDKTIDENIKSENIKSGVSILGVEGNVIELKGEERTTTPTEETQVITPSEDKNAITQITVNPIPSEYVVPTGTLEIAENGTYNVTNFTEAVVDIENDGIQISTIDLHNKSEITPDYYLFHGKENAYKTWSISGYIPVENGKYYIVIVEEKAIQQIYNQQYCCKYDINKNYKKNLIKSLFDGTIFKSDIDGYIRLSASSEIINIFSVYEVIGNIQTSIDLTV